MCTTTSHKVDAHTNADTQAHTDILPSAFSLTNTLTPLKLPLTHLCPHMCTHRHTNGGEGGWDTTSNPEATSAPWRSREEGPLPPGPHSSQPYGLCPQRALWLLEALPGPRVSLLPTSLTPWPSYSTPEHSTSSRVTGSYFRREMDTGPPKTGISQLSIPADRLGKFFFWWT